MTAAFDLKRLILCDCLTHADLRVLLTAAGYDIQSMFNPVDKQNVPSACKLLKAVAD